MMRIVLSTISLLACLPTETHAWSPPSSRRAWFHQIVRQGATVAATSTTLATPTTLLWNPQVASAATADDERALESVYFGVGCFWHIQHEFAVAERELLHRNKSQFTCRTGYAGGNQLGEEGKVCYHNFLQVADYGRMGHGEVVGLELPSDQIVPFAQVYFSLFDPKTKDRVDPGDRGGEYRSLMGLPGGVSHPLYPEIVQVAQTAGFTLKPGKGNDPDTLRQQLVYVYDTKQFPFHQAEVYHQFHVSEDETIKCWTFLLSCVSFVRSLDGWIVRTYSLTLYTHTLTHISLSLSTTTTLHRTTFNPSRMEKSTMRLPTWPWKMGAFNPRDVPIVCEMGTQHRCIAAHYHTWLATTTQTHAPI